MTPDHLSIRRRYRVTGIGITYRAAKCGQYCAVTEPADDEPMLTVDQGYLAAYYFIRQFYERDGRKPESMFSLLSWMELDGPRLSSDPAQWFDWMNSVSHALERGEAGFADPLPQPLSK